MIATSRTSTEVSTPALRISAPPEPKKWKLISGCRFRRARTSEAPCLSPLASPATSIIDMDLLDLEGCGFGWRISSICVQSGPGARRRPAPETHRYGFRNTFEPPSGLELSVLVLSVF